MNGAALREGLSLIEYMLVVFSAVNWIPWILMMTAYCLLYFSIDTLIITRALNWFIKDIKYTDIMPIRASAYIISMFNEQIGKPIPVDADGVQKSSTSNSFSDIRYGVFGDITIGAASASGSCSSGTYSINVNTGSVSDGTSISVLVDIRY